MRNKTRTKTIIKTRSRSRKRKRKKTRPRTRIKAKARNWMKILSKSRRYTLLQGGNRGNAIVTRTSHCSIQSPEQAAQGERDP